MWLFPRLFMYFKKYNNSLSEDKFEINIDQQSSIREEPGNCNRNLDVLGNIQKEGDNFPWVKKQKKSKLIQYLG